MEKQYYFKIEFIPVRSEKPATVELIATDPKDLENVFSRIYFNVTTGFKIVGGRKRESTSEIIDTKRKLTKSKKNGNEQQFKIDGF